MSRRYFITYLLWLIGALFGRKLIRARIPQPAPENIMRIRHVSRFCPETGLIVNRIDVAYGFGYLKQDMVCRIES